METEKNLSNDPRQAILTGLELFTDDFLKDGVESLPVQERDSL